MALTAKELVGALYAQLYFPTPLGRTDFERGTDVHQTHLSPLLRIRRSCLYRVAGTLGHLETVHLQFTVLARTEAPKLAARKSHGDI